ncbi:hypothetical protein NGRA_0884 [Nosema granulosis]|uniref:Uncharacterized protein n=1 Tax=Nosema granulosis TaxID=83296 RepID=A0A9P6H005_9MICR|nr:hypothetical protein NGRA_0884 [Nosema granulosis]
MTLQNTSTISPELENNSPEELSNNINSCHSFIRENLTNAMDNIQNEDAKNRIQELIEAHNRFLITDMLGENNDPNTIFLLYEHLENAIKTIDEARGLISNDINTGEDTKPAEDSLKQALDCVGQENSLIKMYEENSGK